MEGIQRPDRGNRMQAGRGGGALPKQGLVCLGVHWTPLPAHRPLSLSEKRSRETGKKRGRRPVRKASRGLPFQWLASGGHSWLGNSRVTRL